MARRTPRQPPRRDDHRDPRGRVGKFTPTVRERILSSIRVGNYLDAAAAYAGVHAASVYRWLARGEQEHQRRDAGEPPDPTEDEFCEFCEAVTRARADAEMRMVGVVQRAAVGGQVIKDVTRTLRDGTQEREQQWTAPDGRVALDYLSRAFPHRWTRRQALHVSADGGGEEAVELQQAQGTPIPELARRLHETARRVEPEVLHGEVVEPQRQRTSH